MNFEPSRVLTAALASLLTACAAPYVPHTGSDASKLRLTLVNGSGFSSAASNIRPVTGGKCGEPVRVQQLFPYYGPRVASSSSSQTSPVLYPRANMLGSPDPQRSDTVELALAPGRYLIGFIAGHGLSNCGVGGGMDLQAGRQYRLDFHFETQQCTISLERLDDVASDTWRTQPFIKGDVCKGG